MSVTNHGTKKIFISLWFCTEIKINWNTLIHLLFDLTYGQIFKSPAWHYTDLIWYGELDGSDHSTAGEGRLGIEMVLQVGEEIGGVYQRQFPQTLRHHIPRPLLRTLAVVK